MPRPMANMLVGERRIDPAQYGPDRVANVWGKVAGGMLFFLLGLICGLLLVNARCVWKEEKRKKKEFAIESFSSLEDY